MQRRVVSIFHSIHCICVIIVAVTNQCAKTKGNSNELKPQAYLTHEIEAYLTREIKRWLIA